MIARMHIENVDTPAPERIGIEFLSKSLLLLPISCRWKTLLKFLDQWSGKLLSSSVQYRYTIIYSMCRCVNGVLIHGKFCGRSTDPVFLKVLRFIAGNDAAHDVSFR